MMQNEDMFKVLVCLHKLNQTADHSSSCFCKRNAVTVAKKFRTESARDLVWMLKSHKMH